MKLNSKSVISNQNGFTLVEIMIGMVIGMLATLVIVQVLSVFEGQKRSTTGNSDAQTNGQIALYNIGRELQLAGFPLMPTGLPNVADSPLECTTLTFGSTGISSIDPVTITNGTSSDTLTLRYGDSAMGGVPSAISAAPVGNVLTLNSNFGCQVNDISFITNGTTCAMAKVTAVSSAALKAVTLDNITAAVAGANLSCLGVWNTITYDVSGGVLQRNAVDSVAGIVDLQAQYGISDSANSNQVTQWVDPTGTWTPASLAASPVNRNRIKAIRIAIIARNTKMETSAVTTSCSSTTAASPTGLCAWAGTSTSPAPTIDLTADSNWAKYRYRVYETIIPLRNMIWSKDTL